MRVVNMPTRWAIRQKPPTQIPWHWQHGTANGKGQIPLGAPDGSWDSGEVTIGSLKYYGSVQDGRQLEWNEENDWHVGDKDIDVEKLGHRQYRRIPLPIKHHWQRSRSNRGSSTCESEGDGLNIMEGANATGQYTTAIGANASAATSSSAAVLGSTAVGYGANASAANSASFARNSLATGNRATAVGAFSRATLNSTAVGFQANASGLRSHAFGAFSNSTGSHSCGRLRVPSNIESNNAIGGYANANGNAATAIGYNSTSSGLRATAVGTRANSSGNQSIAVGYDATASEKNTIAIGYQSNAAGINSTAIGYSANSQGGNSTALGLSAKSSVAIALLSAPSNGNINQCHCSWGRFKSNCRPNNSDWPRSKGH